MRFSPLILVLLAGCAPLDDGPPVSSDPAHVQADAAPDLFLGGAERSFELVSPSGTPWVTDVLTIEVALVGIELVDRRGSPHVPGEGHLIIYVDDLSLTDDGEVILQERLPLRVEPLEPGRYSVRIELRQHDSLLSTDVPEPVIFFEFVR